MLGNGESSSPSNTLNFPQPLYQDCVNATHELLTKHLNLNELESVVGFGMGGQQAYYWMCMFPSFVKSAVVICGSAKINSFNSMLLGGTIAALSSSTAYSVEKPGEEGIGAATGLHAYGKVTCSWSMSSTWFKKELYRTALGILTVAEFIENYDSAFIAWSATDLLTLVKMWQLGDIGA